MTLDYNIVVLSGGLLLCSWLGIKLLDDGQFGRQLGFELFKSYYFGKEGVSLGKGLYTFIVKDSGIAFKVQISANCLRKNILYLMPSKNSASASIIPRIEPACE